MLNPLKTKMIPMAVQRDHGYGRIGYLLPSALEKAGVMRVGRTDGEWDLRILFTTLDSWYLDHFQPDLVLHTMWECDPLPSNWFPWINNAGAVWVPCQFVKDIMVKAGVTRPILVSGYGVDQREYSYVERDRTDDDPYTFFVWGRMMVDRKQTLTAIKAFCKADLPNARMLIKHNSNLGQGRNDGGWLSDRFPEYSLQDFNGTYEGERVKNVRVLTGSVSTSDLARLMYHADCMVYPSGNEGFGMMPLEFMATGGVVIAPATTGLAEYMNDDVALILRQLGSTPSEAMSRVWGQECSVVTTNVDEIVEKMRWCYYHRDEAADLGRRAARYVAEKWTWEAAGERGAALLQEYAATL